MCFAKIYFTISCKTRACFWSDWRLKRKWCNLKYLVFSEVKEKFEKLRGCIKGNKYVLVGVDYFLCSSKFSLQHPAENSVLSLNVDKLNLAAYFLSR